MRKGKHHGYAKYGYIFSIPFMVAFILFSLYPIVYTALIGFTDLKGLGMTNFHFLTEDPFRNFKIILTNPSFQQALRNTVFLWICNFIPQILLALLLTAWFTDKRSKVKGQGLFKVLFYMPNIITAATVAILFNALFGYPMGPVNDLLVRLGITNEPVNLLINKAVAKGVVIFIQTWMWFGNTMIMMMSGILGINPSLFEAANIDGANSRQVLTKVTLPLLRPMVVYTLITSMIGGLQMFDIPYLYHSDKNAVNEHLRTVAIFVYENFHVADMKNVRYGYSGAASVLLFLITVVLGIFVFRMNRDADEARKKKERRALVKEYKKQQKLAKQGGIV